MSVLRSLSINAIGVIRAMAIALVVVVGGTSAYAYDAEFDYNGDGVVDAADTALILAAFNTIEGQPEFDPRFDHDGDGFIGGTDISIYNAAVAAEQ